MRAVSVGRLWPLSFTGLRHYGHALCGAVGLGLCACRHAGETRGRDADLDLSKIDVAGRIVVLRRRFRPAL